MGKHHWKVEKQPEWYVKAVRKLRDGVGGNSSFATMIDREPTQTSRFMGDGATKNIGDSMARHIEKCFDLPVGWLDQEHQTTNITKKPDVSITNKQITLVPACHGDDVIALMNDEANRG